MDTRYLAMYVLTCKHRTLEGLFELPKGYACSDLRWDQARLDTAWRNLISADFMRYDEESRVIFIVKALKHQSPQMPNHITSAIGKLKELPRTHLLADFFEAAQEHAAKLADRMRHAMGDAMDDAITLRTDHEIDDSDGHAMGDAKGHSLNSQLSTPNPPIPPEGGADGDDTPPRRGGGRTSPDPEPEDLAMADLLQGLVLENNPTARVSDSQMRKWANDCRLMRQQDGRALDEIEAHIRWTQGDPFWSGNVLSMAKVRKHWDTHTLRMASQGQSRASPPPGGVWGRQLQLDGSVREGE